MAPNGTRMVMLVDDEPAQVRLVSAMAARAGWRSVIANDPIIVRFIKAALAHKDQGAGSTKTLKAVA